MANKVFYNYKKILIIVWTFFAVTGIIFLCFNFNLGITLSCACFLFIISILFIEKAETRIVKNESELYRKIIAINEKYKKTLEKDVTNYKTIRICNSKREFDSIKIDNIIKELIIKDLVRVEAIMNRIRNKIYSYQEYKKEYQSVKDLNNSNRISNVIKVDKFLKIEEDLYKENYKQFNSSINVKIIKKYISEKGRNSYVSEYDVPFQDFVKVFNFLVGRNF